MVEEMVEEKYTFDEVLDDLFESIYCRIHVFFYPGFFLTGWFV